MTGPREFQQKLAHQGTTALIEASDILQQVAARLRTATTTRLGLMPIHLRAHCLNYAGAILQIAHKVATLDDELRALCGQGQGVGSNEISCIPQVDESNIGQLPPKCVQ